MAQVSQAVSEAARGQMQNVKYLRGLRFNKEGEIDNDEDEEDEEDV